jgi:hypothetical protein
VFRSCRFERARASTRSARAYGVQSRESRRRVRETLERSVTTYERIERYSESYMESFYVLGRS